MKKSATKKKLCGKRNGMKWNYDNFRAWRNRHDTQIMIYPTQYEPKEQR